MLAYTISIIRVEDVCLPLTHEWNLYVLSIPSALVTARMDSMNMLEGLIDATTVPTEKAKLSFQTIFSSHASLLICLYYVVVVVSFKF